MIGGCHPEKPQYLGFIYNILVTTRILRAEGSTADIVGFFQIAKDSPSETLSDEDVRLLTAMGVKIMYLPKSEMESFYDTVLNKFKILGLVQYKRVLLLDGDVTPITNLDYLFEMSMQGVLRENVVVNGPWEPANAGFFMVAPQEGDVDQIQAIIDRREQEAVNITDGHKFDVVRGWGHVIEESDPWLARKQHGTNWTFHFGFSDQGLCKRSRCCDL